ncbi:MAG: hypothetical protein ACFFAS_14805 [Promethearchaeota archaeon]
MKTEEKIEKIKFEDIQNPENFYVISDNDDLVLNSKKTVQLLLNELESVEYDEKLAKFYSTFHNVIDDRTKIGYSSNIREMGLSMRQKRIRLF